MQWASFSTENSYSRQYVNYFTSYLIIQSPQPQKKVIIPISQIRLRLGDLNSLANVTEWVAEQECKPSLLLNWLSLFKVFGRLYSILPVLPPTKITKGSKTKRCVCVYIRVSACIYIYIYLTLVNVRKSSFFLSISTTLSSTCGLSKTFPEFLPEKNTTQKNRSNWRTPVAPICY